MLLGYLHRRAVSFGRLTLIRPLSVLTGALFAASLLATGFDSEAATVGGANMPKGGPPRVAPKVPQVGPGKSIGVPRTGVPTVNKGVALKKTPGVGTGKKVVDPGKNLTSNQSAVSSKNANKAANATPKNASPKDFVLPDTPENRRRGVVGCTQTSSGITCPQPGGTAGASSGSPTGGRPPFRPIPWFVPIEPTRFVGPLECPQGHVKVGETFYGGTKCAPVSNAAQPPVQRRQEQEQGKQEKASSDPTPSRGEVAKTEDPDEGAEKLGQMSRRFLLQRELENVREERERDRVRADQDFKTIYQQTLEEDLKRAALERAIEAPIKAKMDEALRPYTDARQPTKLEESVNHQFDEALRPYTGGGQP